MPVSRFHERARAHLLIWVPRPSESACACGEAHLSRTPRALTQTAPVLLPSLLLSFINLKCCSGEPIGCLLQHAGRQRAFAVANGGPVVRALLSLSFSLPCFHTPSLTHFGSLIPVHRSSQNNSTLEGSAAEEQVCSRVRPLASQSARVLTADHTSFQSPLEAPPHPEGQSLKWQLSSIRPFKLSQFCVSSSGFRPSADPPSTWRGQEEALQK